MSLPRCLLQHITHYFTPGKQPENNVGGQILSGFKLNLYSLVCCNIYNSNEFLSIRG